MRWLAHHDITDGASERVDGYLSDRGRVVAQLDVAAFGDACCVTADEQDRARVAWAAGAVFLSQDIGRHGVPTLVVPFDQLTWKITFEAIERFRP